MSAWPFLYVPLSHGDGSNGGAAVHGIQEFGGGSKVGLAFIFLTLCSSWQYATPLLPMHHTSKSCFLPATLLQPCLYDVSDILDRKGKTVDVRTSRKHYARLFFLRCNKIVPARIQVLYFLLFRV